MSSLEDEEGNSENHDKDESTELDGERNGPVGSGQSPTPSETVEDEERSEAHQEEEKSVETAEEEDVEIKVCGDLWSSGNCLLLKQPFCSRALQTCDSNRTQVIPQQRSERKEAENLLVSNV